MSLRTTSLQALLAGAVVAVAILGQAHSVPVRIVARAVYAIDESVAVVEMLPTDGGVAAPSTLWRIGSGQSVMATLAVMRGPQTLKST